jgi:hypothetical protein
MPYLLHWALSLSLLTPRMLISSHLLLSHATLRLMMPTTPVIVNDLVVILIHASMLYPEAGVLREKMIVSILEEGKKLNFRSTTHEQNLYQGTIDDKTVLVCHQVDDIAIASRSRATADKLSATINKHVTTDSQGIGICGDG